MQPLLLCKLMTPLGSRCRAVIGLSYLIVWSPNEYTVRRCLMVQWPVFCGISPGASTYTGSLRRPVVRSASPSDAVLTRASLSGTTPFFVFSERIKFKACESRFFEALAPTEVVRLFLCVFVRLCALVCVCVCCACVCHHDLGVNHHYCSTFPNSH